MDDASFPRRAQDSSSLTRRCVSGADLQVNPPVRNGRHVPTFVREGVVAWNGLESPNFNIRVRVRSRQDEVASFGDGEQMIFDQQQPTATEIIHRPFHRAGAHIDAFELRTWTVGGLNAEMAKEESLIRNRRHPMRGGIVREPKLRDAPSIVSERRTNRDRTHFVSVGARDENHVLVNDR